MQSFVKKLPQEIIDYFLYENEHLNLNYFTERKLRPLTLLASDDDKLRKFYEMQEAIL